MLLMVSYVVWLLIDAYRNSIQGFMLGIHPEGEDILRTRHRRRFGIDAPIHVVYTISERYAMNQEMKSGGLLVSVTFCDSFQPGTLPGCHVHVKSHGNTQDEEGLELTASQATGTLPLIRVQNPEKVGYTHITYISSL